MICPDCMGTLAPASAVLARCTTHGGVYRVLFDRPPAESAVAATADSAGVGASAAGTLGCARHPDVATTLRCRRCRSGVCSTCAFAEDGGTVLCPDCASGRVLGLASRSPVRPAGDVPCARHPEVASVERCSTCQSPVCATCDFAFEGDLHFCPSCATSSASNEVSSKRRRLAAISYVLALVATLCFLGLFFASAMAQTEKDAEAMGALFGMLTLIPAIVGVGLGVGAVDRRLSNPWWLRGAGAWNGLLLALFLLLAVYGTVAG